MNSIWRARRHMQADAAIQAALRASLLQPSAVTRHRAARRVWMHAMTPYAPVTKRLRRERLILLSDKVDPKSNGPRGRAPCQPCRCVPAKALWTMREASRVHHRWLHHSRRILLCRIHPDCKTCPDCQIGCCTTPKSSWLVAGCVARSVLTKQVARYHKQPYQEALRLRGYR